VLTKLLEEKGEGQGRKGSERWRWCVCVCGGGAAWERRGERLRIRRAFPQGRFNFEMY
jgi:hypothetical protein